MEGSERVRQIALKTPLYTASSKKRANFPELEAEK